MENIENNRITDFIIRYKKIFTREECRDIIQHIEFFDENSLLYPQNIANRPFQDQDANNIMVDSGITLPTVHKVTKKIFPRISSLEISPVISPK